MKTSSFIKKLSFPFWSVPIALLLLVILGFGMLIPWLGFYQDDWYLVWYSHIYGPQFFIDFFSKMRPLLAGIYMLTTQLVGDSATNWQIFGLLTRWLAVIAAWWSLLMIWPKYTRQVTWIAFLFAVYPAFKQHWISVVYSQVYIMMAAYFASLGLNILGMRKPRWRWPANILGVMLATFTLVSSEYFFGMELLRPVFIWLVAGENALSLRQRIKRTFLNWSPYLVIFLGFFIWRVFFYEYGLYDPKLVQNLEAGVSPAVLNLFQTITQDMLDASFMVWIRTLDFLQQPHASFAAIIGMFLIVLAFASLAVVYLRGLRHPELGPGSKPGVGQPDNTRNDALAASLPPPNTRQWSLQAIGVGLFSAMAVGWPFWYAGLSMTLDIPFDRFSLAFMFGGAIFTVGLLELLIRTEFQKIILIGGLVGLSVLSHFNTADSYRQVHKQHGDLFRQLAWRAPGLAPGTKLLINELSFPYTGNASMSAALNWVYTPLETRQELDYKLLFLPFKIGSPDLPSLDVNGNQPASGDMLVAWLDLPGCLKLIDPAVHANMPGLAEDIAQAIPLSNLGRIEMDQDYPLANVERLFGREDRQDGVIMNWCYYYEKADLARQNQDWAEVTRLGDQAAALDLAPASGHYDEHLPFIEAYGRVGRWDEAAQRTLRAYADTPGMQDILCDTWARLLQNSTSSPERDQALERLAQRRFSCPTVP